MLLVISTFNLAIGQSTHIDSLVNQKVKRSEKALYDANFKNAYVFLELDDFKDQPNFTRQHELQLTIQRLRVEDFERRLQMKPSNPEIKLQILASFLADTSDLKPDMLAKYFITISSAYRANKLQDVANTYKEKGRSLFIRQADYEQLAILRSLEISLTHMNHFNKGESQMVLDLIPKYREEISFSAKHSDYALSYNTRHLAQIYRRQTDDYEEALHLFNWSLDLRLKMGFKPFIPASYSSLGDVYVKMGKNKEAINMFKTAFSWAAEVGFIRYLHYPQIQIGDIYMGLKEYDKALEHYERALQVSTSNNYSEGVEEAKEKIKTLKASN